MRIFREKAKYASHIFNGLQSDEEHKQKGNKKKEIKIEGWKFLFRHESAKNKNREMKKKMGNQGNYHTEPRIAAAKALEEKFKK
jgi:hypothetical protein